MKHSNLISALGAMMALCASSCSDEVPPIPANELYTRAFVKEYGVVNPGQDWNAAENSGVNVTTDAPAEVKIVTTIRGKKYLLADYKDVSGTRDLRFDIPKGVRTVEVRCGSERQTVSVGGKVSFANAGRSVGEGTFGTEPAVTVEVLTGPNSYLTLSREAVTNYVNVLPEQNGTVNYYEETNLGKITQNFYARASEFYIFPQFWNTGSYTVNRYGIYYYVNADTEGAEKVKDNAGNDLYIKKVCIFDGLIEQLGYPEYGIFTKNDIDNQLEFLTPYINELISKYPERYKVAEGGETVIVNGYGQSGTADAGRCIASSDGSTWYLIPAGFPQFFVEDMIATFESVKAHEWGGFTMPTGIHNLYGYQNVGSENIPSEELLSTGVHVKFSVPTSFGFYIDATSNHETLYSESKLNGTISIPKKEGDPVDMDKCFVATYVDENPDTEGNVKRYLCFEDWYNVTNFDLNDAIFRIYGFDNNTGTPDEPGGEIVDEDKPEPIRWLLACEDLGNTDDFDFNDVVFEVEYVAGSKTAKIIPLAAGGTLETYLMLDVEGEAESRQLGGEWHGQFGVTSFKEMINTTRFSGPGKEIVVENLPENFSISSPAGEYEQAAYKKNMGGFFVRVINGDNTEVREVTAPGKGEAPQIILIFQPKNTPWRWPLERHGIHLAYKGFQEWMKNNVFDASAEENHWSLKSESGHVVDR